MAKTGTQRKKSLTEWFLFNITFINFISYIHCPPRLVIEGVGDRVPTRIPRLQLPQDKLTCLKSNKMSRNHGNLKNNYDYHWLGLFTLNIWLASFTNFVCEFRYLQIPDIWFGFDSITRQTQYDIINYMQKSDIDLPEA